MTNTIQLSELTPEQEAKYYENFGRAMAVFLSDKALSALELRKNLTWIKQFTGLKDDEIILSYYFILQKSADITFDKLSKKGGLGFRTGNV